ncbi:MAG TPA: GNAT family N-acetyltransferase [Candidatus Pacearchaeota archaeon]|nr:GNAT family N-acetyltransferase [Candidatus Pacearchaeota archaeon]
MSFQEVFPEILSKTYSNCSSYNAIKNLPGEKVKSKIFGEKIIFLPFLDTLQLSSEIDEKELNKLLENNEKTKLEIRTSESDVNLKKLEKVLMKKGFVNNVVKGHILSELTSQEDFWNRFHKHTRNDIRKAEKSSLEIKKIGDLKELKQFYSLYLQQMKEFGTPQHSFLFFKNCLEVMLDSFYGLNCYFNKRLIGSIILFINKEYAYVSFNVSNPKYRGTRVNDLLYWEAIKWGMKNKIKKLDIGQVDLEHEPNSREENLFKFKTKWLGKVYKKVYFTKNFAYESSKKDSLKKFRAIWKKLPLFLIKFIGPLICSQLG